MRFLAACAAIAAATAIVPTTLDRRSRHMRVMHRRGTRHALRSGVHLPADQFYNQTLDHFDTLNVGYWPQRFWTNASFWQGASSGAPVFLYIEGEGAGNAVDVVQGQHVELAAQHGALIVALEHRFFGASVPTPDLSVASMRYLSTHQALGDLSRFITEYLVPTYGIDPAVNKVVSFGGSYPGALSAWARLRLPHLISFAFSTSSPVHAQYEFSQYCDVVSAALSNPAIGGSQACLASVAAAFSEIDAGLRGTPAQQAAIASRLFSCAPPTSIDDVKLLASNAAGVLMGVVQYNDDGVPGPDVNATCAFMTQQGVDPVDLLGQLWLQTTPGQNCSDNSYADFLASSVGNTTADKTATGVGIRQWTWMTCTEFSYFQTADPSDPNCPFSPLMDEASQVKLCQDAFSPVMDADFLADRVDFTNDYLGGYDIAASNILFTNGGVDPWHALSVTPANANALQNASDYTVWIPTGAHCRNMFPSLPTDPADVKAARAESAQILANFLAAA